MPPQIPTSLSVEISLFSSSPCWLFATVLLGSSRTSRHWLKLLGVRMQLRDLDHRMIIHIERPGMPVIFTSETRSDVSDIPLCLLICRGLLLMLCRRSVSQLPANFVMECVLATVVENTAMETAELFGDDDELLGAGASLHPQTAQGSSAQHHSGVSRLCHQFVSSLYTYTPVRVALTTLKSAVPPSLADTP